MKKIRLLSVIFDTRLKGHELPAFRGAIIDKVGKENILFHNHLGNKGFLYRYPLIQYKIIGRNPAIICVDYGIDEMQKYFNNKTWDIQISDRLLEMKIKKLIMNQFEVQIGGKNIDYNLYNWIALNQDNYENYKSLPDLISKVEFLERTLTGNILSFAKGIDWTVDNKISLKIYDIINTRSTTLKGKKILGFDIAFSTNVVLPDFIGLGKSVSLGFGIVRQARSHLIKD